MTALAKIGPIELSQAHEIVDPESDPGKVQISIKCKPEEAKQLVGLCQHTIRTDYRGIRVIRNPENRWGFVPIESPVESGGVSPNEYTGILKGLVSLSNPQVYYINPRKSRVVMTGEMLSENMDEILSVIYSKGGLSGGEIDHTYTDDTPTVVLDETFDGAYTTNWTTVDSYNMSGVSVSTSGGKLVMTGTNGSGWGGLNIDSKSTFNPPFEVEFDLEYVSDTNHNMSVYLVETVPHNWTDLTVHGPLTNYIRVYIFHHDSNLYYAVVRCIKGVVSYLVSEKVLNTSTEKNPKFKLHYDEMGYLTVWIDKAGGTSFGNPIWGPGPTGLVWPAPGFCYHFDNVSGSSQTMKSGGFKVSEIGSANYPNIVVAPPGAVCNLTPDFYRNSEDGLVQCFKDLTEDLNLQVSPENFYKGSVKGWNSNYTDNTPRLVTGNNFDLSPNKFTLTNGLVRIRPQTQSVVFEYWNGSAWVLLNTFTLPNPIKLLRPSSVSPYEFTLQIDRTSWTIRAGKPFVYIEHQYTNIGFSNKESYYHDGVLENNVASGVDVSMLSQFYALNFKRYNLLTAAQTWLDSLDGWAAQDSVISQVSGGMNESPAIQFITDNTVAKAGIRQSTYSELPSGDYTGLSLQAGGYLKGLSGGEKVCLEINERASDGSILATTQSSEYTLTTSLTPYTVNHTIQNSNSRYVSMKVLTTTNQAVTVIGDSFNLAPLPIETTSLWSVSPFASSRYGMFIVKKDPTTIKSDSIPASDITGIGVFDQMQPPTSNDYYLQLAREWYKPTRQSWALEEV